MTVQSFLIHTTDNSTLGSVPFLLKDHLSYSQLATFSLSSYPYSLKLLWSPIVDAVFFPSIGRRKSWIVPMQMIVGTLMLYISLNVQRLMEDVRHIRPIHTLSSSSLSFAACKSRRRAHLCLDIPRLPVRDARYCS